VVLIVRGKKFTAIIFVHRVVYPSFFFAIAVAQAHGLIHVSTHLPALLSNYLHIMPHQGFSVHVSRVSLT